MLLTQQLTAAGFGQFAIGIGQDASRQALTLLYHPAEDRRFGTRQAFLAQETGLQITVLSDVPDEDNDQRHFQEVQSGHFNQAWGRAQEIGENPRSLRLAVYSGREAAVNLQSAFERAWESCREFAGIRWDINSFTFRSSVSEVSLALFGNVQTRWRTEPGNPEHIFFPVGNSEAYADSLQALLEAFGRGNVEEPEPQLDLFG